jgi:16S rRNA G1207 methylase RsmC
MAYLYSRFIIPMFEDFLRAGRLVLDVGCGKGGLGAIVKTVPEKKLKPLHCWRGSRI